MKEKKEEKKKKKGKKRQEKGNGKSFDHATKNRWVKQVCGLNSCRSKEKKHTTKRKIRKRWW